MKRSETAEVNYGRRDPFEECRQKRISLDELRDRVMAEKIHSLKHQLYLMSLLTGHLVRPTPGD